MSMSNGYRSFLTKWAVAAVVLGAASGARAADPALNSSAGSSLSLSQTIDPTGASSGFLQRTFINGTVFDDARLKVRGYMSNFDRPGTSSNGYGILFNDKTDDATMNQLSLIVQRDVIASPSEFDF